MWQQTPAPGGGGGGAPGGGGDDAAAAEHAPAACAAAEQAAAAAASELLALSMRSACHLATQLAAAAARLHPQGNGGVPADILTEAAAGVACALRDLALSCPGSGPALNDEALLACQPHRLMAAAAALVFVIAPIPEVRDDLAVMPMETLALFTFQASPGLSSRVRA
ncbi:hypothetical protein GPECTOR_231g527 [Gonium pectorale]|uniref:Uncharacterized protein n=1 Tax=Gonium pectorale TaxID=33097 RepID=A0A150FY87_GONPE|nr:hypothetical protein GPECTOR_231g527 [Gonium pectorale]|eukprot:KXZ41980.1 hypothetical protein GPECTOR_231g527 [Gonium pectorale]